MDLGNGLGLLTYSTLVHPGDTWEEMWASLVKYVPQVKARFAPNDTFGISLRLSASSARNTGSGSIRAQRSQEIPRRQRHVPLHGERLPYGPFKGGIVKERVYEPDWRSEERTQYTINVAEVLGDVAPVGTAPSIQSARSASSPG